MRTWKRGFWTGRLLRHAKVACLLVKQFFPFSIQTSCNFFPVSFLTISYFNLMSLFFVCGDNTPKIRLKCVISLPCHCDFNVIYLNLFTNTKIYWPVFTYVISRPWKAFAFTVALRISQINQVLMNALTLNKTAKGLKTYLFGRVSSKWLLLIFN